MLNVLRDRFVRLGRDEDGVALVVTLGVFMFIYVTCASVYAVGMAVKEKLHLQGACDAAAYSAAIVQADTFSRIATINRAMSWTYQQMTKRQMDYIVWQWLEEVVEHHNFDMKAARYYAEVNNHCSDNGGEKCLNPGCCRQNTGWDCSDITLESKGGALHGPYSESQLSALLQTGFPASLRANAGSFYSRPATLGGLGDQIDDDLRNVYLMSEVVDNLARGLPERIEDATSAILHANVPAYMACGDCWYFISQAGNPLLSYFRVFSNTPYDEQIFLSYDDNEVKSVEDIFGAGIDSWFVRGDGQHRDGGEGIHRSYDHTRPGPPLRANWTWWATGWNCGTIGPYHRRIPNGFKTNCGHSHDKCFCFCDSEDPNPVSGRYVYEAKCSADNSRRYDNRFRGHLQIRQDGRLAEQAVYARPLKLTANYFGNAGTITVGLARRNENPWFSLFGRITGGIYSAFSPIANSWSYCFASAKAGYKLYHVPKDFYINAHRGEEDSTVYREDWEERYNGTVRVYNGPRDYCVDWKEDGSRFQDWITPWKRDEHGNYVRDRYGNRVKEDYTYVYFTNPTELRPSWRQSWNLVQDDWDAVMVPVRQGGSSAREGEAYSLREWWRRRIQDYARDAWQSIPYRFEPAWERRNGGYLASLVNNARWQSLSGSGVPNTAVTAGPVQGDRGDPLNGRLAGEIWEGHWKRGIPPPTATGTSQWDIGNPGARLDWGRIGDEMYH